MVMLVWPGNADWLVPVLYSNAKQHGDKAV